MGGRKGILPACVPTLLSCVGGYRPCVPPSTMTHWYDSSQVDVTRNVALLLLIARHNKSAARVRVYDST